MARRTAALGALASALLLLSALSAPAEARRGGEGWQGRGAHSAPRLHVPRRSAGPRLHSHRRHSVGPRFRHRQRHIFVPVPGVYGPDYYYRPYDYDDSCYWLRRKAFRTGSPYWWNRYYDCVDGYYDD